MIDPTKYESYTVLTMGRDGTIIASLNPEEWSNFISTMIEKQGTTDWYNTTMMQHIFNATGVGYYPNGVTLNYSVNGNSGKTIIVSSSETKDFLLLSHEYGHVLGYEHTKAIEIEIMNPVANMRHYDKHGLTRKFINNFPEYYERFILPTQRSVDKAVTYGVIGAIAWGLLR
jgi:hypothetical protein